MTAPPARVLVLGVDAASPELLTRWAENGALPNLRALMDRGLTGRTESIDGFFVGSTWPSFSTGVNPARHGIHYLLQIAPGTYDYHEPSKGDWIKHETFWAGLSREGKRVAIVDVPLSRIDGAIDAVQVVEWGGHDAIFRFQTQPPSLRDSIGSTMGCHPQSHTCDAMRTSSEDYRTLTSALVEGARARARLTGHLLGEGGWDLFAQVFTESHCVGHQCWHLHDPAHPGHDAAMARTVGDPIRQVYVAIDQAIGDILDMAGDATVIVVSAHGMSHWFGAHFLLPEILFRLGMAERPLENDPPGLVRRVSERLARLLGRKIPRTRSLGVDASASKCFAVGNGLATGGIRVNLIGREPAGLVARGEELDRFCAELTEALLEIIDERTGRPLISRVVRTADLYTGEHLEDLPDLLVHWDDEVPTGSSRLGGGAGSVVRVHSPRIGTLEGRNSYGRTGEHRIGGMFIAAGPGIKQGRLDRVVSIMDFAPTFAALLGVKLRETDGVIIPEISGNQNE